MRKLSVLMGLVIMMTTWAIPGHGETKSLKDIYKTGQVRFDEVLRITNDTLPEGIGFRFLVDMVENEKGNIFILDSSMHRLFKFSPQGKLIKSVGGPARGPGELYMPLSMTIVDNKIIIFEYGNERFSFFDFEPRFIKIIKPAYTTKLGPIHKMQVLPGGDIALEYEIDRRQGEKPQEVFLDIFSTDFKFKKRLFSQGYVRYKIIDSRHFLHPFFEKMAWTANAEGRIFLGFCDESLVKIFDPPYDTGKSTPFEYDPIKITEGVKQEFYNVVAPGVKRFKKIPDIVRNNVHFPGYKPPFYRMYNDPEGNILVFPKGKTDVFYALDSNGNMISKVNLLSGKINARKVLFTQDGLIWFLEYGEDYEHYAVKCKITPAPNDHKKEERQ